MKFWIIAGNEVATIDNGTLQNVIKKIHWRRGYTKDNQYTDKFDILELPDPSPDNFIDYSSLTYEQYCYWLETYLNVSEIDASLDQAMEYILNPPTKMVDLPFKKVIVEIPDTPGLTHGIM